jgi:hypothetical protein
LQQGHHRSHLRLVGAAVRDHQGGHDAGIIPANLAWCKAS